MFTFISNLFTARNNVDYSLTKLLGICAGGAEIVKFVQSVGADYQGFGIGIASIMAALAAKYYVEGEKK